MPSLKPGVLDDINIRVFGTLCGAHSLGVTGGDGAFNREISPGFVKQDQAWALFASTRGLDDAVEGKTWDRDFDRDMPLVHVHVMQADVRGEIFRPDATMYFMEVGVPSVHTRGTFCCVQVAEHRKR